MFVTECSVGTKKMSAQEARDLMIKDEEPKNFIYQLQAIAGLCNASEFDAATYHLPLSERKIAGDATDQAVFRFSESLGPVRELQLLWRKTFELAFNSKNKFMIRTLALAEPAGLEYLAAAEAESWKDDDLLLTIKGAPDILIERCTTYVNEDGHISLLDARMKMSIEEIKNYWSSQGKRVILLARKVLPGHQAIHSPADNSFEAAITSQAKVDLTLVGLVGIVDPPRNEIPEVVRILRRAGIRIFMVTGDFKLTAQAIAIECGIISNPASMVHDVSMLPRDTPVLKSEDEKVMEAKEEDDLDPTERVAKSITLSGPEIITLNENQWNRLC
jgi:sodium/potassium-transporting ATPase subunit alpha